MTHAWCSDPSRDEAVRAAEDGRQGPLPTLEAVIAEPFAEAAKCSPAVSETGETQSGLRTERVTLEIKHFDDNDGDSVYRWNWAEMMAEQGLGINESVRVVEESLSDAWAQRLNRLTDERDAAIRERDEWKADAEKSLPRIKLLLDRVAELESAPAASGAAGTDVAEIARRAFDAGFGSSLEGFNGECAYDHLAPKESTFDGDGSEPYEKLKRDSVAKIMSEAASGAAGTEPVAWAFVTTDGAIVHVSTFEPVPGTATVFPLYASPPPARAWLTAEERGSVLYAIEGLREAASRRNNGHARTLESLLARSKPPEVVLPQLHTRSEVNEANHKSPCLWFRRPDVIAALAAAGVAVKEVGK